MHDIGFLLHGVQNEIFPISKEYTQEEFWVELPCKMLLNWDRISTKKS